MKFRLISGLIVVNLFLFSCKQSNMEEADNVQYFRHMQFSETPFDPLKGIYPISQSESKDVNHFRFTLNQDGLLEEVSYLRGNELLGTSPSGVTVIKIEYTDSTEIHSYFDKNGEQVKSRGAWHAVYTLDDNGTRTSLHFTDLEGKEMTNWNGVARFDWQVLPDGMVRENRYNLAGEETVLNQFCPFYELRFSYDGNGYVTRMANYMADTLYDCTVENCGDVGVSYFLFENDPQGALTSFSVHNSAGQLSNLYWGWARFENVLDENGYVLERISYDQDNELLGGKAVPVNVNQYDEHGALIERKFLDANRELMANSEGAAIIRYSYDKLGHPVDTTLLGPDEKILAEK